MPIVNQTNPITLPDSQTTAAVSSYLELILAKLIELDVIKSHLNTIDTRLDLLQLQPNYPGLVAQRS